MGLAGCTTVSSVPPPDNARSRPALAPDAGARPSAHREPAGAPSGKAALVRTGGAHPDRRPSAAAPTRHPGPDRASAAAPRPRAVAPAAPPGGHHGPERRTPVRRPAPRPRPAAPPSAAARMREMCRQADGVAEPRIVRLCHDTFG
ncbi:hypothetical protein S1361_03925 [Streptomyces cyanogenus]|uniref:Uncharacterized protein n=2 Tax=Streptomyces cyanogenus TaxID=80860 RepID=A0ABX7TLX9_STRCY|nr:hypothetical protein S1361_03925 [Streptomyces cyanogenus]